jgi:hypothetical protein
MNVPVTHYVSPPPAEGCGPDCVEHNCPELSRCRARRGKPCGRTTHFIGSTDAICIELEVCANGVRLAMPLGGQRCWSELPLNARTRDRDQHRSHVLIR